MFLTKRVMRKSLSLQKKYMSLQAAIHSGFIIMLMYAAALPAGVNAADTALQAVPLTAEPEQVIREPAPNLLHTLKEADPEEAIQSSVDYYEGRHHLMADNGLKPIIRPDMAISEWMLYVILVCFFSLALARLFFPDSVSKLIRSVFRLRFFIQADKENMILRVTASYLLKLNYLLCISLLIMQSVLFLGIIPPWEHLHPVLSYTLIFFATGLFYVLKYLLVCYLGWLFNTRKAGKAYFNNIFVLNHVIGMVLLPLVFYQVFNPLSDVLIVAWVLLLLLNVYKVIRGIILGQTHTYFPVYYLFLYLCGVELAPLLILGKAASVHLF